METSSLLHRESAWQEFRKNTAPDSPARALLLEEGAGWLRAAPPNIVTGKKHLAVSGDPHDYVSLAVYSWPDPAKADGKPWINRDGVPNPEFYEYDNPRLEAFARGANLLLLTTESTGSAAHAEQAAHFFRSWFLDDATRMNPHLRYAQFIPGFSDGRFSGIIDTTSLVFVLDAATRLPLSAHWTAGNLAGMKAWVSHYLDWLLESDAGKEEGVQANNHGVWYDAQVAAYALFCDRPDVARRQIEKVAIPRLPSHIEPDGSQPHELVRTLAFTYCTYNLLGFACLAQMGARFGLDLWKAKPGAGGTMLQALHWLLPYYSGERPWTHPQIHPFDMTCAAVLLNLAWQGTGDAAIPPVIAKVAEHPWQAMTFYKASLSGRKPPTPS